MRKILIVDDNKDLHLTLELLLKTLKNIEIYHAYNGMEGYNKMTSIKPDLTILDNQMPVLSGFGLLERLAKEKLKFVIVMLTAHDNVSDAVRAIKMGAQDYVPKPFKNDSFFLVISKALKLGSLKNSSSKSTYSQSNLSDKYCLIGESSAFITSLNDALLVAPTNMEALILGSNGTGKEEIAKYIHYNSPRKEKNFITLDCGAIPDNLIESELFGHKKGSFTGAEEDKVGLVEAADGGTLFLDEIGNLSMKAQNSLLRFLQTRKIFRVGGTESKLIDIRIISATNSQLLEEIENCNFREDLFHRINGFTINIPDLCERSEDIPLLATFFVKMFNKELNKQIETISPEVINKLKAYNWPGNIREFRNTIRRAVLRCLTKELKVNNIDFSMMKSTPKTKENAFRSILKGESSMDEKLDFVQKELISQALTEEDGNKSKAAKRLKISRKKLYSILTKLKIGK
ncbi:MAG: hypothetical protein B6226_00105 [Candidatus Cloacimonetes bacterium 4572_65]|nr:MAG: hypothetical protein B6226_00105 [Candidatus Cloacimonetes bacterium 4572_65]